jgi:hypothetical protein
MQIELYKTHSLKKILLFILLIISSITFAQKIQTFEIKTINGDIYFGQILKMEADSLIVKTSRKKEIVLVKSDIKSIDTINLFFHNYENNFGNKYFISNSAIPLKKKDFYFHSNEILTNGCEYGLTNNFSIGGGIGYPWWYVNFKLGFSINRNIHLNTQVFSLFFVYVVPVTFASTNLTIGNHNNNITVGYGLLFRKIDNHVLVYKISVTLHLDKNFYLLTENYIVLDIALNEKYYYVGFHGIRYILKNNSFNLGLLLIEDIDFPIPYFGFSRKLNSKKKNKR